MKNVYPFVKNPGDLPTSAPIYKIMEKLNAGGKLNKGKDDGFDHFTHKNETEGYCTRPGYDRSQNDYCCFSELWHPDAYKNGIYRLAGYVFDFRPHFKKYLVHWKYYGWQEHYAPCKMFIRENAASPHEILQIVELEKAIA